MPTTSHRGPFVVVLTGGIASGKTAVSDRFAKLGVAIIDTDVIARELVQAGQPALAAIVNQFGQDILDQSGQLDRRRMREIVFSDALSKKRLEAILHPAIGLRARQLMESLEGESTYCILVVPLLVESGIFKWGDRLLVVDVDEETQISRVSERDQVNREQAEAILKSQATRQQRLALADDVIENTGSLQQLDRTVSSLHEKYLELASLSAGDRPVNE